MKENLRHKISIVEQKFSLIKSLIDRKEFRQALAELREFENQRGLSKCVDESEEYYHLFALALQGVGNYKEACLKAKRTLDLLKNTSRIDKFAQAQFVLGRIYLNMGDLKKAERELRDAMAGFRRLDDKKGIIPILNELAHIHFVKSEYSPAIEYLNQCMTYCDEIEDKQGRAKVSANLGRIHIRAGNWKLAEAYLEVSTKTHKESGNKLAFCNGLLSLGYVCSQQRDFTKAKECYESALKLIYENNYTREFAIYHEYAGELEFAQGNYDQANNHYLEAIGIGKKIADESGIISQTYRLLAELQIVERQYDEALASCEKALKVATSLGERIEIGAIHRALGLIHTAKNQKEKARENFEKSICILEQIGAKFELGKAYLEAGRSNCFDFFDRVHYLRRAKDVFKELDSKYHQGLVHFSISKLFFENEEYEKALLFSTDAEKTFKELKEEKELSAVLSFRRILEKSLGKSEKPVDARSKFTFDSIITRNRRMQEIITEAREIKDSNLTMLLEGETGTGKDLLAKAIHYESKRKNKSFVVAQCSAIPESLLENALFGHVKGAYTGANENSVGLFQEADGGTLYLDEIAEIPLSTQVKLLRAIEEKEISRIGETKPKKIDVRIIVSTSRDLYERISKGLFRQDLYFRLNALSFKLPPLRDRKEDIPPLINSFLKEDGLGEDVSKILGDPEFSEKILEHDWPGNIRELKHEIEKLGALALINHGVDSDFLKERMNNLPDKKRKLSLCEELAEFEKKKIIEALQQTDGIKLRAAEILGIPETTLRNKLKKYKIESLPPHPLNT